MFCSLTCVSQMPVLQSFPKDYCENFGEFISVTPIFIHFLCAQDMEVLITEAEVYYLEEKVSGGGC